MDMSKCVKRLRRRADHLKERIERGNPRKVSTDFDRKERDALTWAIAFIEQYSPEPKPVREDS